MTQVVCYTRTYTSAPTNMHKSCENSIFYQRCVCCMCVCMTNEADVSPDPNDDERKIYFQKYSLYAHRKINKFKLNHTRTPTVIFLGTSHLFLLLFFFKS